MTQYAYYETDLGLIEIGCRHGSVVSLKIPNFPSDKHDPSALSDLAAHQLKEYLSGNRTSFDLPLDPLGTQFQRSVWEALLQIPYGETWNYRQVAERIGNVKACRAVGAACGKNPIWILIPCHRVVGSSNSLTGYAGGLDMKQKLLRLENSAEIQK